MQCCIVLWVFRAIVVIVQCCIVLQVFKAIFCHTHYGMLGITVDCYYCGIMQWCIVLWVFRAIVAKAVYHCILPRTMVLLSILVIVVLCHVALCSRSLKRLLLRWFDIVFCHAHYGILVLLSIFLLWCKGVVERHGCMGSAWLSTHHMEGIRPSARGCHKPMLLASHTRL